MQKIEKTLQTTLDKYRRNKTMVSPEDLAGKYAVPFQKLKAQLKEELNDYMCRYLFEELIVKAEDFEYFYDQTMSLWREGCYPKRIGCAVYKDFDLAKAEQILNEFKEGSLKEFYSNYFNQHVCLYAYRKCFDEKNPRTPLIYNDLVGKFWDESTEKWVDREKPAGDAILIFINREEVSSCGGANKANKGGNN